jgi:hypothetical protein
MMMGAYGPSSRQGAGHAVVAHGHPAVRLLTETASALHPRSAPRLLRLLVGVLFDRGRRTATAWFRAAGISSDFRCASAALWAAGQRAEPLAYRVLAGAPVSIVCTGARALSAIGCGFCILLHS